MFEKQRIILAGAIALAMFVADAALAQYGAVSIFNPRTGRYEPLRTQQPAPTPGFTQIGAVAFYNPRTGQYQVPATPGKTPTGPGSIRLDTPDSIIQNARNQGLATPGFQRYNYRVAGRGAPFTTLRYPTRRRP